MGWCALQFSECLELGSWMRTDPRKSDLKVATNCRPWTIDIRTQISLDTLKPQELQRNRASLTSYRVHPLRTHQKSQQQRLD